MYPDVFQSLFQNNSGYVEELFERFEQDPSSVGLEWQGFFSGFRAGLSSSAPTEVASSSPFEWNMARFVMAWKHFGHLKAYTNPLATIPPKTPSVLLPESYGIEETHYNLQTQAGSLLGFTPSSIKELIDKLHAVFAGPVGAELEHIQDPEERAWLYQEFFNIYNPIEKSVQKQIYEELATADSLEKTIGTKYIGKKRFSIEGADSQIVACESFLDESAKLGMKECTIAIAHRGRLNFLVNVIKKPLADLFAEFEGYPHDKMRGDHDVKYHAGYESERTTRSGLPLRINMPFNPSHLEYVDSVAMGDVRARQTQYHGGDTTAVACMIFHGDAAIAGQGIVYETAQMMSLTGYNIGGIIHVVANNQVGFTTDPSDSRSSTYCTDVAKVTGSPVFHINAEHVDDLHCLMIMAAKYRAKFKKDFYVDLVCFRRFGHNEADEPTFTQPLLYKIIKDKPAPYETYLEYVSKEHGFSAEELKERYAQIRASMNAVYDETKAAHRSIAQFTPHRDAKALVPAGELEMLSHPAPAAFPAEKLKELAVRLCEIPDDFHVNAKLSRIIVGERKDMAQGQKPVDWGMAELLAYATLLEEGFNLRLVGEDVQRGTFSHRHATLVDSETGAKYTPLAKINTQTKVEIINSLLSEEAAMGYEYAYAATAVNSLVIWEGQFGDFANGAQVIIDQFLAAGETKWCQQQGLVLLLPHGLEGQGPEHSSARPERFLQLCAEGNMQICYLTKASQIYHALRRQMHRPFRKPLIIMSPKSFLRSPRVSTSLEELSTGSFSEILDDTRTSLKPENVKRVLLCCGKIALDLLDVLEKDEYKAQSTQTVVIRIEQIYPLHTQALAKILSQYKKATELFWVQEEPANMGAWPFLQIELAEVIKNTPFKNIFYCGRSRRASPAVGLEKLHLIEQDRLLKSALTSNSSVQV